MRTMRDELPSWLRGIIIGGAVVGLAALELTQSLRRRRREPKLLRTARNLVIAATGGLVMSAVEQPLAMRMARYVDLNGLGLVPRLTNLKVVRVLLGVVLLDYGLYLWHILTHKVPFLWRFHLVHHVDLDMDASTALRFHAGEMLASVPWRLLQIRLTGASPLAVSVWQTLLFVSILFHHSNVRLPLWLERWLRYIVVTPRLHGIHHEAKQRFTNSNWSSGLAIWDLLHGTHRWHEHDNYLIGVPDYQRVEQVTLPACLAMPFTSAGPGFVAEIR
jgi:sterol desaturase/sphingolipid hydroxylase (fatty acid hydroxylase superfamily)